ncbi:GNAT family N-acetyltransferase [Synechococcus sp. ATX 2A4]|uniref:GNAT family N-acetyltransferase n=1 Tax=Synechococcus sp. ATX 2A4 TaxID=2823727 RepID=UPI0020CD2A8A|nr:GNAT family N-acetyltransferase [Synechococcus sp. ATX 2A4]MCP9883853.1 GNAT family N-acetyltransferase [Synechococcus sp. ATX 2A4]
MSPEAAVDGTEADAQAPPRRLGPADLEACLSLDRLALGGLWDREQWQAELKTTGRLCLGLDGPGGLEAMASGWLVVDELQIMVVAVHPACRQRGRGQRLLRALLQEARQREAQRATLEVAAGNTAAQALYAALGFRTQGRRCRYYRTGEDALIQCLGLAGMVGTPPAPLGFSVE